ncbi:SAM-dependent methyltransferase [Allostreptomyces psammosilenae]|uniref:Cyclopropane-fatty-acyl-phospholipid synthase n=1 Tax=Allostreptomyces psammosilenae TaxID=1892865 RepID=A0A852ZVQ1_9ACTN|nr:class I SAM-dependent methyltransferase [Allostreptomyces psammosilenae]NYI06025.1 cyclopropane-fatty-acyl-phospholipid synthase [Allostreptomyces psammosilenae]
MKEGQISGHATAPETHSAADGFWEGFYAVDSEFFRLWTDRRLTLSCGLWTDPVTHRPAADLDAAQEYKLHRIADLARVRPGTRVLDIGSGFGGMLDHLVQARGVAAAHGVNLIAEQCEETRARGVPGVSVDCVDYRGFTPTEPFDAAVSIQFVEHIAGEAGDERQRSRRYREFFGMVHDWTVPGAFFGLEAMFSARPSPRISADHERREQALLTDLHYEGKAPLISEILAGAEGFWEVLSVQSHRDDYVRTEDEWLRRLNANEATVRERWGDALFETASRVIRRERRALADGAFSVAVVSLRRVD